MSAPKPFASGTDVAPEKSRAEIEAVLKRYGASGFAYATQDLKDGASRSRIEFVACERRIRFELEIPPTTDERFYVNYAVSLTRHAAEVRRLWRALLLGIKAKLELAVGGHISTFEAEFLAHIVMPDGRTVGEQALPRIAEAYERQDGTMLALMPGPNA